MPLSIDNAQFDQFVRFAEQAMQAGKAKTIASLGAEGATGLAARGIKPGSGDSVGAWRVSMGSDPMDTTSRSAMSATSRPPTPSPSSTSTATSSTWIICRASRSSPSRECPWGLTPWTLVQKKEAVQA